MTIIAKKKKISPLSYSMKRFGAYEMNRENLVETRKYF